MNLNLSANHKSNLLYTHTSPYLISEESKFLSKELRGQELVKEMRIFAQEDPGDFFTPEKENNNLILSHCI